MLFLALFLAIVAIVMVAIHASRSRPWHLGWLGLALFITAVAIWHAVGGDPIFLNK